MWDSLCCLSIRSTPFLSAATYPRLPMVENLSWKSLSVKFLYTNNHIYVGAAFQQLSQAKQSPCSKWTSSQLLLIIISPCHFSSFTLARTSSRCALAVHPLTFFSFTSLPSSVTRIGSGCSSLK